MITKEMIEAGKKAYWGHFKGYSRDCFTNQIVAIYEAMIDQKQKDAIIKYQSRELYGSRSKEVRIPKS